MRAICRALNGIYVNFLSKPTDAAFKKAASADRGLIKKFI
jgi:hypothetical protein